jgi:prepilin-type N-terminal cleavage/methylation domain-containing protein
MRIWSRRAGWGRNQDGFTLIEVLVSLVLLALVLAMLSGAVRFARGTWDAAARLDREAGHDVAGSFLRARLGEAMPLFEPAEGGMVRVAFDGAGEELSFVAPTQNGPAGAGLYRFTLRVATGGGARALSVNVTPYQPKARAQGAGDPIAEDHVLVEDVKTLAFRYFGRAQLRAPPAWHEAWPRKDALPDLVELSVTRRNGNRSSIVIELPLRNRSS